MSMTQKHAGGRPKGRKLTIAVEKASQAVTAIAEVDSAVALLNENQRLIFESIMTGDDALQTALKTGNQQWFTGVARKVDLLDGSQCYTTTVTAETSVDLTDASYQRLLRLCESQVRNIMGTDDYRKYTIPIREYVKRFAPLAFGVVVDIAQNGVKEENRLKAANSILDRAGEREPEPEKDVVIPVQVNIQLTQQDGSIIAYGDTSTDS